MAFKLLAPDFHVSPQMTPADVAEAARLGLRSIICNRPDGEATDQPGAETIRAAAEAAGLAFAYIPVATSGPTDDDAAKMAAALDRMPKPVLAYCRSGARSSRIWQMARAASPREAGPKIHDVVIIGGGSAGIATAASLLKRRRGLSIAIVEPGETHYYQPGWTLVGAGVFRPETTRRNMASVMPDGVDWVKAAAAGFQPEENRVILSDGSSLAYRALVVAPGLTLDWDAIPGLAQTLGRNGVTSNYRYDLAPYTNRLTSELRGGRALFTQPPMPIKCAGAPQKAMYLSCDRWRKAGTLAATAVEFHSAAAVLFGVPAYVPALMQYVGRYGIDLNLESKLLAVDGAAKVATFQRKTADGSVETVERGFSMLHAVPPQVAPDFVRSSPLAAPSGFVAVDEATLQHPSHPNIFALGDVAAASNAKTAAAARKQAPVVAENVLAVLSDRPLKAAYDGYGSCPLTVERGRIVLAEFGYGGKLLPTFPTWLLDGRKPTRAAWFLKDRLLPAIYWHGMLKGREWLASPPLLASTVSQPA